MADSIITKLLTALTAKTSADDTDIIPVGSSDSNLFKMTFENLRKALLGDATLNTSAQTIIGAINENKSSINTLNTNLAYSAQDISNISGVTAYAYKSGHVVNFYIRDFGTAISVGSKIATLPSGWIPSYEFYIRNAVDNANGYLDVTANGEMYLRSAVSSTTSLSYVLFAGSCIVS